MNSKNLTRNIVLAHEGDQKACKSIYDEFMPYAYGICVRYGIDKHDVRDLLQIVFSSVFLSLKNYNCEKASFKTWIARITVNKILDFRTKRSKEQTVLSIDSLKLESIPETAVTLSDRDYIFNILSKMPKKYQEVFNLFVIDGFSHKEISQKLDISEISSRTKLMRGREWSKKALSNYLKTSERYGN